MRVVSHNREIVRLALPAMAALAADPLLSLVDTALVGRLGAVPLGALGVSVALFTLAFFGFNFLTYGTTDEVARLRGAGRPDAASLYACRRSGSQSCSAPLRHSSCLWRRRCCSA